MLKTNDGVGKIKYLIFPKLKICAFLRTVSIYLYLLTLIVGNTLNTANTEVS